MRRPVGLNLMPGYLWRVGEYPDENIQIGSPGNFPGIPLCQNPFSGIPRTGNAKCKIQHLGKIKRYESCQHPMEFIFRLSILRYLFSRALPLLSQNNEREGLPPHIKFY